MIINVRNNPAEFDPTQWCHAFVRRFLTGATSAAALAVAGLLSAAVLGHAPEAMAQNSSQVVSEAAAIPPATPAPTLPELTPASFQEVLTVMVELADQPAAVVYAESLKTAASQAGGSFSSLSRAQQDAARTAAASDAKVQVSKLEAAHQAILPTLASMAYGGNILFRTKSAYNGISMLAARGQLAALAKLPGVKAVHIQTPKFQTAPTDIDFLGARSAWTKTTVNAPAGIHGENIKIAIIDTGLDYIHTNFGGPGTPAAYSSVTDTGPVPNAYFPSAKVPGGYDFAGDSYDANTQPIPHPDSNPLDSSNGHGTACASLIGGLGVASDGSTYAGIYDNTTNISSLKISPGFAPKALLYPLRVFGVSGSTNLVVQAINWAVDPNGDGNIADHMDVISMSLGANSGYPDDPDAVAASNAAAAGVIVASAAGNAGDSYYIVSSPSVGSGVLSVAATFNDTGGFFFNANATANSPPALAGQKYNALYGVPNAPVSAGGLTGDVVYALPADGSSGGVPVTALTNAADMPGKICMIDRGVIGFANKVRLCQDAGAVASIVVQSAGGSGTPNPITMSLSGPPTSTIPAVMIGLNEGNLIKAQLNGQRTGVNVTINNDNGFVALTSTAADTMPSYSARGPRLGDSMLKPDISAPAEVVGVATSLTGNQVEGFNGTSSATPHVAGMMALLRQLHPTWTVEELMALAMNTATHNEFTGSGGTGSQYGTGRVGAGRIDITNASTANVVAYNQTDRGLVNVSFGIVEVPVDSSVTRNKNIAVKNNGAVDVTYNVTYVDATPATGATFTVGSGSPVTVPAGGTVTVPVTFSATGNLLKHEREASVALSLPSARQWLTEKTGYAVFTPTGGTEPTLRVALYASPKPVSAMRAAGIVAGGSPGQFNLSLLGAAVNTGVTFPTDIISLAKPFELQYVSPQAGSIDPPVNPNIIKYVGVTSDYVERGASPQNTVLTFLLEGFGNASVPSFESSDKEIYFDVNGDGTFDYAIYLSSQANGTAGSNVYVPFIVNLTTGAASFRLRTNGISPATRDTNSYNNSVVTIPVMGTDIGLAAPGNPTKFHYEVVTFDRSNNVVDDTGLLVYDMAAPGLDGQGGNLDPFFYNDVPGTTIPVTVNAANFLANNSRGLILAHMHNATGARTEVAKFISMGLSRALIDFGSRSVNTTSPPQAVTVTNTGVVSINVMSIVASTSFAVTHNCATLAPAASCTANVTFTPAAQGSFTGTLTVQSTAGQQTVALAGAGQKVAQTITFAVLANRNLGDPPFTVSATASSALAVTFSTTTAGVCSSSGTNGATVTILAAGTCTIAADQPGNVVYNAAPQVSRSFTVLCDVNAAGDCDNDGIPNAVEAAEGRNPMVKDNDIFGNARLFAMQQYRDFLSREGDPAGITGWTNLVTAGTYTRPQAINAFLLSDEFAGVIAPVVRLYFATFARVPDYAGLTFNAGLVRNGTVTITQLADFFTASPEFVALYGSLNNTQFVTLLYNNVLARAPDTAGLNGWVALLNGGSTRGQVLLGFSESPEYQAAKANQVLVTMMYAGMLRRTPDPAGFNGWVGGLDARTYTREQVINGFFTSAEYHSRFLP